MTPRGRETRPTSDRVREALFMVLEPLVGLRVVDLFAGSGALGIEALSRGADRVDFVEAGLPARRALEANITSLEVRERSTVWPLDLPSGLKRLRGVLEAADLILMDPPYRGELARRTLEELESDTGLKGSVRVVVEHHAKDSLPARLGGLERIGERRYGETRLTTYRRAAPGLGEDGDD